MARLTGVSLRSVNRIAEASPVVHVEDSAEREKGQIGKPSEVESFRKLIVGILEETLGSAEKGILRAARSISVGPYCISQMARSHQLTSVPESIVQRSPIASHRINRRMGSGVMPSR